MESNYSLADLAAITNGKDGFLGGNSGTLIILFLIIMMMGGGNLFGNRGGEWGQYATAASQNEILSGQKFDAVSRQINAVGDGLASSTFALNNTIVNEGRNVQNGITGLGQTISNGFADMQKCCCETQRAIDGVNYNIATTSAANTQKILDAIAGNRMADMQNQINQLQMQNALAGVVRYPTTSAYCSGTNPFCGCGNTAI